VSELAGDAYSQSRGPMISLLLVVVAIPTVAAHFAEHICHCIDVGIANGLLESDIAMEVIVEK
jgi:hypothetical protein